MSWEPLNRHSVGKLVYLLLASLLMGQSGCQSWGRFWEISGEKELETFFTLFGGSAANETLNAGCVTSDGGYVLGGQTDSGMASYAGKSAKNAYAGLADYLIVKFDAKGEYVFHTYLGSTAADSTPLAVACTTDGGAIVSGLVATATATMQGVTPIIPSIGGADVFAAKLDSNGNISWWTNLGSAGADESRYSVLATKDGGYVVAVIAQTAVSNLGGMSPILAYTPTNWDSMVVKLTSTGTVSWYTFLGGGAGAFRTIGGMAEAPDGSLGIVMSPNSAIPTLNSQTPANGYAFVSGYDFMIYKLSATGVFQWYTMYGASGDQEVNGLAPTSDGGFLILGRSSADIPSLYGQTPRAPYASGLDGLIMRVSSGGVLQWYTFVGSAGTDTIAMAYEDSDQSILFCGNAAGNIAAMNGVTPYLSYNANYDLLYGRMNSDGTVKWYNFIGTSGSDSSGAIAITKDGGLMVGGHASGPVSSLFGKSPLIGYSGGSGGDLFLAKFKPDGRF